MSWTAADIPDQTGRVAVVTGANGGLGLETARELARKGAHVVMAARNLDKAEAARADIESDVPGASLEVVALDLSSMASVEEAAAAILDRHPQIHDLVNNAGVMATPETRTEDGFELQFATNHLGHFVLTARLLPALIASGGARVVTVTSTARFLSLPVSADDPHLEMRYGPWRAYGQSKLANVHFAVELNRRLDAAGAPVESLVAHPGLTYSDLQKRTVEANEGGFGPRLWAWLSRTTGMSVPRGALPQLRAATGPSALGGQLYAPRFVNTGAAVRRPLMGWSLARKPARRLWEVSERETGVRFDVAALARAA